ncbi:hypothetical protein JXA80_01505 [bacterium]|nr:hypothetical protein [candidate division CSSED10-310 bacterium]
MDQSQCDEIERLKRVIESKAQQMQQQDAIIQRQMAALEEMVRMRRVIAEQESMIEELTKRCSPGSVFREWIGRLPGICRQLVRRRHG